MYRIPHDVLSDIFLDAPLTQGDDELARGGWIDTPRKYAASGARSLFLPEEVLWSQFFIGGSGVGVSRRKDLKSLVDTYLARTNGAPICCNVVFQYSRGFNLRGLEGLEGSEALVVHIIKKLIQHQHQWDDVRFFWTGVPFPDDTPAIHLVNMPALTSLRLCITYSDMVHTSIDFRRSSKLKKVIIEADFFFDMLPAEEPIRSLTLPSRLHFRDKSQDVIRSCLNFLSAAPFLKHVTIDYSGPDTSTPTSSDAFIVHGLRRLSSYCPTRQLFDKLILPYLEALQYLAARGCEPSVNFFIRSSPPLVHLDISVEGMQEDSLIEILRLVPTLRDLRYNYAAVSSRLFRELQVAPMKDDRIICPVLEILVLRKFNCLGNFTECIVSLICMLESRAQIMDSFEFLRLYLLQFFKIDVSALNTVSMSQWQKLEGGQITISPNIILPFWFSSASVFTL
ncbi:hypothetical protein ACEPAI_8739 [Sanghuangporus weigelae]